jgi:hypothetical protein
MKRNRRHEHEFPQIDSRGGEGVSEMAGVAALPGAGADTASLPYPPSALNRFFAAVERLPGRGWWVYPLSFLVLAAWNQIAHWLTGSTRVGTLTLDGVSVMVFGPYAFGVSHFIVASVAPHALDAFRPASGMSDVEYAVRRYNLLTMPAGVLWVPIAIGAVIALGSIGSASAAGLAQYGGTASAALLILGPGSVYGYAGAVLMVVQGVRQLRIVHRLHQAATAIDPFDVGPIYAFSRLTSFIGAAIVVASSYALLTNGDFQAGNVFVLGTIVGTILAGVACFIVPLWGIHGRLTVAKAALVRAASIRAQALQERLYRKVDAADLTGVKDIGDALAAVRATSERIEKLPTWPWPPQVMRGFLSAILLPVVVYVITRYLAGQLLL